MRKYITFIFFLFIFVLSCNQTQAQQIWGLSVIAWNEDNTQVSGLSGTYLDMYAGYYYDPWVYGCLYNQNNPEYCYSEDQQTGESYYYPAEVGHPTFLSTHGQTYCTYSDHRVWAYYYNNSKYRTVTLLRC